MSGFNAAFVNPWGDMKNKPTPVMDYTHKRMQRPGATAAMVPTTNPSKTKPSGTSILNRRLIGVPVSGSTPTTPRVPQPLSQLQPSAANAKRPATRATVKAATRATAKTSVAANRLVRRPAPSSSQTQATKGGGGGAAPGVRDLGSASSLESKPAKRSKKLFPSPKAQRKKPSAQGSQDSLCAAGSSESMLSVQEELTVTKKEKSALEKRVKQMQQEYHHEVVQLRTELASLQERSTEMDQANSALRARLHNVAHSPLSDTEKQQLLQQHNAANPISTSPDVFSPSGEMDVSCTTPDWDNKSGSSEVSVACLQDRIMQMEETHYSTNEELQATLQELADLQTQLTELQSDNERLLDEKNVLLESLCRQTEKLEDSRTKVDTLQELLLREGQGEVVCTEREQKLVDLLKSSQEERETLLSKQDELNSQLSSLRETSSTQENEVSRLRDRVALLESAVDAAHKERAGLDRELACAKQDSSSRQIEISRLATLLENARAKIEELEATRELGDKTEMDEILDGVRKEKDLLESQVASLQEQLSRSQVQVTRLREQTQHLQEECKVTRNNAKSQVNDLEYERNNLKQEMKELAADLQSLKETASELQVQCQCHLEDKRQLKSLLSERQRDLAENERKLQEQGEELEEEKKLRQEETVEWSKFQSDLLMAVRVANDFKTEAQHELEKLVLENKALRDKNRSLDTQLDRQKAQNKPPEPPAVRAPSVTETTVLTSVQQELQVRRQKTGISRQDSRLSVKSLIDSIENATKQAKNSPGSRSSSTSSLSSIASGAAISNTVAPQSPTSDMVPLREQQNKRNILADNALVKSEMKRDEDGSNSISIFSKNLDFGRRNSQPDISERKDPLAYLVKNGGSKRNALLKWCQNKTVGYRNIDITNFSSSWNDGLALCAILHTYLPDRVPYDTLTPNEKRRNFTLAFAAAESVGVPTTLNLTDMIQLERPDWQQVIAYITALYRHFET